MPTRADNGFRFPRQKFDESTALHKNFRYLEAWLSAFLRAGQASATVVVAAQDSLRPSNADFRCDGTADDATIREAINSMPAAGGRVVLLEGTYNCVTDVTDSPLANVHIQGQGIGSTILNYGSATGGAAKFISANTSSLMISDLTVIGNPASLNGQLIELTAGSTGNMLITNCEFKDWAGSSDIFIFSSSVNENVVFSNNIFDGMEPNNFSTIFLVGNSRNVVIDDNMFINCFLDGKATPSFVELSSSATGQFVNNMVYNSGNRPFPTTGVTGVTNFHSAHNWDASNPSDSKHAIEWHGSIDTLTELSDVTITSAAKGDILVYDAVVGAWVDLSVGTDGQVLKADSSDQQGIVWGSLTSLAAEEVFVSGLMLGGM